MATTSQKAGPSANDGEHTPARQIPEAANDQGEALALPTGVSFGTGNATKYNKRQNETDNRGNAFDPNKANIATFPWVLSDLAKQRPDLIQQGYLKEVTDRSNVYYVNSKWSDSKGPLYTIGKPLYAQFTYNGRTYGAVVNDVGSGYGNQSVEGGARLFDINYKGNLLSQLGVPDPENLKGASNFSILGGYNGQKDGALTADEIDRNAALVSTDRPVEPDKAVAHIGEPPGGDDGTAYGSFSTPDIGTKVYVFFYDGDPQRPIYFAQALDPSSIQQANSYGSPTVDEAAGINTSI